MRMRKFGNSEVARFLSLDPHAVNYLSWSAYHYVAANPILFTDPTGKDWEITKSTTIDEDGYTTTTYNIKINMAILNTSDTKYDATKFEQAVKEQILKSFDVSQCVGNDCYNVKIEANIRTITDLEDLGDKEHLLKVSNQSEFRKPGIKGKAPFFGLQVNISADIVDDVIEGKNKRTVPHELGHTGGLHHPKSEDAPVNQNAKNTANDNVMHQGIDIRKFHLTPRNQAYFSMEQVQLIEKNYRNGNLNE
jgi:hypothetical protein